MPFAASPALATSLAQLPIASRGSAGTYLDAARTVLRRLTANAGLLDLSSCPRKAAGYTRNLIYAGDGVSVWALIWSPRARTPIHDHHCSCCFGVMSGIVRENWFRAISHDRVLMTADQVRHPGYVACMLPSGPNIHQMLNETDEEAVSIHIYGYDHDAHASSVDHEYQLATD